MVDVNVNPDVGTRTLRWSLDCPDIGIVVARSEHELLNSTAQLLDGSAIISGCEFTHRTVHVGLSPEETGPVVEEIEVMGIIALHLDDLELNVLVIDFFFS
ncbi:MAG TPA: hypothetical protein VJW20_00170 [Candidatus Angelobacter sp.]|nr:hypothetical protein [Candidatus Angelobacter sp.]